MLNVKKGKIYVLTNRKKTCEKGMLFFYIQTRQSVLLSLIVLKLLIWPFSKILSANLYGLTIHLPI